MAYSSENCMVSEKEAKQIRPKEALRKERTKKFLEAYNKLMKMTKNEKEKEG